MNAVQLVSVVLVCAAFSISEEDKNPSSRLKAFAFKNCGDPATETFKLMQFKVTPDPIELPGSIRLSLVLNNTEKASSPIKMDVVLKKKFPGKVWVNIPCMDNFGSCSYPDVCELLDKMECPASFLEHSIPCHCPLPVDNFTLPETKFEIDAPIFPVGDYSAKFKFTFHSGSTACYEVDAAFT